MQCILDVNSFLFLYMCVLIYCFMFYLISVPAPACEKFVWGPFCNEFNVHQNTLRTPNGVQSAISLLIMNNVNLVRFYVYTLCLFGASN